MPAEPPPVPSLPRQVAVKRFEPPKGGFGILTYDRLRKLLDQAQGNATQWINENPDAEIISVDTTFGQSWPFVSVWYRR